MRKPAENLKLKASFPYSAHYSLTTFCSPGIVLLKVLESPGNVSVETTHTLVQMQTTYIPIIVVDRIATVSLIMLNSSQIDTL